MRSVEELAGGAALYSKDTDSHIATILFNRPEQMNCIKLDMYGPLKDAINDVMYDDAIKVLVFKGAGEVFCTGHDLREVYDWYMRDGERRRRPSQRRRLAEDRKNFGFWTSLLHINKVTIAEVKGYALGGGFELMLACDFSVAAHGTEVGMPATRFLGPSLGDLFLFFHRLGPVMARDLLLTGRRADCEELASKGLISRFVAPELLESTVDELATQCARMPADGLVIAKEAYRIVEQSTGLGLAEPFAYFVHAFATNLGFEDDEFNFVKTRAKAGITSAFDLRDQFFEAHSKI